MQTNLHPDLASLPQVQEADEILRKCVHCGFCTATCPTYQLLGDELDGPRGRIYLIKNMLEENALDAKSAQHLDRCLTCRACETTCPSGVEYGRLLEIGREFAVDLGQRSLLYRFKVSVLRLVIPQDWLFKPLLRLGQSIRFLLPGFLRAKVPPYIPLRRKSESTAGSRVLLLSGCVQSAVTPSVVHALGRLLSSQGVSSEILNEGCCGALDLHLSASEKAMERMRLVIDELYPRLDEVDMIISSATGCGVTIKEYASVFQYESVYRDKAAAVADMVTDAAEALARYEFSGSKRKVAVHTPCSLQHGMQQTGTVEAILERAGFDLVAHKDGHLCCGSAGTYSLLQPELSTKLRSNKLQALEANDPELIVTANIGCQVQLSGDTPVMHWLELLAESLPELPPGSLRSPLHKPSNH